MKQFYETYASYEKVSPLVTQNNWTNNLLILSGTKSNEEKEFFLDYAYKRIIVSVNWKGNWVFNLKLSKLKLYNYRCFGDEVQVIDIDNIIA